MYSFVFLAGGRGLEECFVFSREVVTVRKSTSKDDCLRPLEFVEKRCPEGLLITVETLCFFLTKMLLIVSETS